MVHDYGLCAIIKTAQNGDLNAHVQSVSNLVPCHQHQRELAQCHKMFLLDLQSLLLKSIAWHLPQIICDIGIDFSGISASSQSIDRLESYVCLLPWIFMSDDSQVSVVVYFCWILWPFFCFRRPVYLSLLVKIFKFGKYFLKHVRLTVCVCVCVSVCNFFDTGHSFWHIITKLGPNIHISQPCLQFFYVKGQTTRPQGKKLGQNLKLQQQFSKPI